jgi:hypothetical protein
MVRNTPIAFSSLETAKGKKIRESKPVSIVSIED